MDNIDVFKYASPLNTVIIIDIFGLLVRGKILSPSINVLLNTMFIYSCILTNSASKSFNPVKFLFLKKTKIFDIYSVYLK